MKLKQPFWFAWSIDGVAKENTYKRYSLNTYLDYVTVLLIFFPQFHVYPMSRDTSPNEVGALYKQK